MEAPAPRNIKSRLKIIQEKDLFSIGDSSSFPHPASHPSRITIIKFPQLQPSDHTRDSQPSSLHSSIRGPKILAVVEGSCLCLSGGINSATSTDSKKIKIGLVPFETQKSIYCSPNAARLPPKFKVDLLITFNSRNFEENDHTLHIFDAVFTQKDARCMTTALCFSTSKGRVIVSTVCIGEARKRNLFLIKVNFILGN